MKQQRSGYHVRCKLKSDIPKEVIESLARCILLSIEACFIDSIKFFRLYSVLSYAADLL